MADLEVALAQLEGALRRAGHPLADPALRPPGRPTEETQRAAEALLGGAVPDELVTLWGWWSGEFWPAAARSLDSFERRLPGGVRIASLEESVDYRDVRKDAELTTPASEHWLPAIFQGDDRLIHWCEIDNSVDGLVPVTVNSLENPADSEPLCRLESIADLALDMARLLDEQLWVDLPDRGWHYVGDFGVFEWIG